MNTHDDLRDVLRSLESQAPDPSAMQRRVLAAELSGPNRRRQLKRMALPATVAAAIIAGAVTLAAIEAEPSATHSATSPSTRVPSPTTAAPTSAPPTVSRPTPVELTWTFAVGHVTGYAIVRDQIAAGYQSASITVPGADKDIGSLTVYPPSNTTPSDVRRASTGQQVDVRGSSGHFRYVGQMALLSWPTTTGGWAVIEGDWDRSVARQSELAIADATDTGARDVLKLDFGVGYLPPSLSVSGATFIPSFGGLPHMELDLVDDKPGQDVPGGEHTPAVLIQRGALTQQNGQPGTSTFKANMTVNGRPAEYSGKKPFRAISIRLAGNTTLDIIVDETHYSVYSKQDLLRIARSIVPVGDPAKPSTWAPADSVLPH